MTVENSKFSNFDNGGDLVSGDVIAGLRNGVNTRFNFPGYIPSTTIIPIAQGGTGATTAAAARTNLGVAIGIDVQAYNATLQSISDNSKALTTVGGTGLTSYTAGDISYYASGTALSKLAIGTAGQILTSSGTAPQWTTLTGVAVTTLSFGSTGLTPSAPTSGAITVGGTLITSNGGTGLTSYAAGDVPYYASGTALSKLSIGTANKVMTSSGTAPQWVQVGAIGTQASNAAGGTVTLTIDSAQTQIFSGVGASTLVLPDATTLTLGFTYYINNNASGAVTVQTNGGATLFTLARGGYVQLYCTGIGTAAGTWDRHFMFPANATNGQINIGSTGSSPVAATLTPGTNIAISNGAGSITIAATGLAGMGQINVTGTSATMTSNNQYVTSNAGLVTLTLPVSSVVGDILWIRGNGAGGWLIAQAAGQQIVSTASTTLGVGGSIASTNRYDAISLCCIVNDTIWQISGIQSAGLTIV